MNEFLMISYCREAGKEMDMKPPKNCEKCNGDMIRTGGWSGDIKTNTYKCKSCGDQKTQIVATWR